MKPQLLVVALALTTAVAGCAVQGPAVTAASTAAESSSSVPPGYKLYKGDSYSLAVPEQWEAIPEDQRSMPEADAEIGVVYTGQATLQPTLFVTVDRTENLGSPYIQAQYFQVVVKNSLLDPVVGDIQEAQVKGATSAVWFEYTYHMVETPSRFDTTIEAADYRLRALMAQAPGTPMVSLRYGTEKSAFDETVWQTLVDTLELEPAK
ncbi:MAG: hypothetical protein LBR32_07105 [Propionibacteriaceae bacterium]|nr:hypothetical protein [Propionibacteriaceae bacterium]